MKGRLLSDELKYTQAVTIQRERAIIIKRDLVFSDNKQYGRTLERARARIKKAVYSSEKTLKKNLPPGYPYNINY